MPVEARGSWYLRDPGGDLGRYLLSAIVGITLTPPVCVFSSAFYSFVPARDLISEVLVFVVSQ